MIFLIICIIPLTLNAQSKKVDGGYFLTEEAYDNLFILMAKYQKLDSLNNSKDIQISALKNIVKLQDSIIALSKKIDTLRVKEIEKLEKTPIFKYDGFNVGVSAYSLDSLQKINYSILADADFRFFNIIKISPGLKIYLKDTHTELYLTIKYRF